MVALALVVGISAAILSALAGFSVGVSLFVLSFSTAMHFVSSLLPKREVKAVLSAEEDQAVGFILRGASYVAKDANAAELVGRFIDRITGNRDFNARALARKKVLGPYDQPRRDLLGELAAYAHKTNLSVVDLGHVIHLAETNWQAWNSGAMIDTKLRREDLRTLESFARSKESFEHLASVCGDKVPYRLSVYLSLTARAHAWVSQVLSALTAGAGFSKEELQGSVPRTGDLVAYTLNNDRYIMGASRPQWIQWAYRLIGGSDATHMALRLGAHESHMWGNPVSVYAQTAISVGSFGNTHYRPIPEKFVDKALWGEKLCQAYSDRFPRMPFDQLVLQLYEEAMTQWHEEHLTFLRTLRNDAVYRILLALLVNVISPFKKSWRQRAQFRADFFKRENQVACSEFVIKAGFQALDVLGRNMAKKLNESGFSTDPSGAEIVVPDINPRRRTQRYSPGMLINRIIQLGLFRELPASPLFEALIH